MEGGTSRQSIVDIDHRLKGAMKRPDTEVRGQKTRFGHKQTYPGYLNFHRTGVKAGDFRGASHLIDTLQRAPRIRSTNTYTNRVPRESPTFTRLGVFILTHTAFAFLIFSWSYTPHECGKRRFAQPVLPDRSVSHFSLVIQFTGP